MTLLRTLRREEVVEKTERCLVVESAMQPAPETMTLKSAVPVALREIIPRKPVAPMMTLLS